METGGAVTFKAPRNLVWKIGALVIAALLWIAVSAEPDLVSTRAVPILYRNLAPQYLLTGQIPESVRVEVRGSEAQLASSAMAETVALFDLGTINRTGEQTFTIADSTLNLPRGVAFLRAVPSQFRLRVARLAAKDVPVDVRTDGVVAPGYRLVSATAEPGSLRIAGSENRVNAVARVETDAVEVTGLSQSAERKVNAFVSDPEVRFVSSPVVSVKLAIERIGN
jgi:YbbR domain-containing protein